MRSNTESAETHSATWYDLIAVHNMLGQNFERVRNAQPIDRRADVKPKN
jgi:hypothetical protein